MATFLKPEHHNKTETIAQADDFSLRQYELGTCGFQMQIFKSTPALTFSPFHHQFGEPSSAALAFANSLETAVHIQLLLSFLGPHLWAKFSLGSPPHTKCSGNINQLRLRTGMASATFETSLSEFLATVT